MSANEKKRTRIELTEEQKKQNERTQDTPAKEFQAEELEERIAPMTIVQN